MFRHHSSFRMFGVTCGHESEEVGLIHETPDTFSFHLQVGVKYGVLTMAMSCTCCERIITSDYLFHNKVEDPVVLNMQATINKDEIGLFLPYGDIGFFRLESESSAFNDSYIMQIAQYANDTALGGAIGCVDMFFSGLYEQLKLKSRFRRWSTITRRVKFHNSRMLSLWFLTAKIHEPSICKQIVSLARLW